MSSSPSLPAHSPPNPLSNLPLSPTHRTFTITAHNTGFLHLPPNLFISPAPSDPSPRRQPVYIYILRCNSLPESSTPPTTILFDLGLRRPLKAYPPAIVHRLATTIYAELAESAPPLPVKDVHALIISHVHYDHIGDPRPWIDAGIEIVSGAAGKVVLGSEGTGSHKGHFEKDLLKGARVRWLGPPKDSEGEAPGWVKVGLGPEEDGGEAGDMAMWMYDFLGDGSVWIVDAPGHLPGHLNVLVRVQQSTNSGTAADQCHGLEGNQQKEDEEWVYLAADTCHDSRILRGDCTVAEYRDAVSGCLICAHHDKAAADAHIRRVRRLEEIGVTVLLSHEESTDPRFT